MNSAFGVSFAPCLNDVASSFLSEAFNGLFFGDFRRTISNHSYFLSSSSIAFFDFNIFKAGKFFECRTDILFTSASCDAGHAGRVGYVFSHRSRCESEERQGNSCN